jgi:hypothetical protein
MNSLSLCALRTKANGLFVLLSSLGHDGTLTAANAGYIAPYLSGKELAIENGLPWAFRLNRSTLIPSAASTVVCSLPSSPTE